VFDPNYDDYATGPRDLAAVGVLDVDGPVVVGLADRRGWLAATDPDGGMRWAGYESRRDPGARPAGVRQSGDGVLVHGGIGTPGSATVKPWLAWLDP
jgi:hypothetical protein